jgi:L-methionine (R)-S-oxide reductase
MSTIDAATIATMSAIERDLQAWLEHFLRDQGGAAGTVHVLDGELDETLVLRASVNIPPKVQDVTRLIPKGKGMAGLAYVRHEPVFTCNLADDSNKDVRPGARAVDATAAVALPVDDAHGHVRAVVGIAYADERSFEEPVLASLMQAASTLP